MPTYIQTLSITTTRNDIIPLSENLNCKSKRVVYAITCLNCNQSYVAQTGRKLHQRFNEHRGTILNKKECPVSDHFNNNCPDMDYLQITPLEHVALKEDGLVTVQMQDGRICNLESRRDRLALRPGHTALHV